MGIDAHHLPPWSIFVLDLWKKNKRQNRYFKFSLSLFPPSTFDSYIHGTTLDYEKLNFLYL